MADSELTRALKRLADPDISGRPQDKKRSTLAALRQQVRQIVRQMEENMRRLHALEARTETTEELRAIARQTEENTRLLFALETRIRRIERKPAGRVLTTLPRKGAAGR